jgi:hypothetical protein
MKTDTSVLKGRWRSSRREKLGTTGAKRVTEVLRQVMATETRSPVPSASR